MARAPYPGAQPGPARSADREVDLDRLGAVPPAVRGPQHRGVATRPGAADAERVPARAEYLGQPLHRVGAALQRHLHHRALGQPEANLAVTEAGVPDLRIDGLGGADLHHAPHLDRVDLAVVAKASRVAEAVIEAAAGAALDLRVELVDLAAAGCDGVRA